MRAAVWRWAPVAAWAALIFVLSSIPDLGTGLGGWDLLLRKIAHAGEYAILAVLLHRALRRTGWTILLGALYAASDEFHQAFVPGREGAVLDVAIDSVGVVAGALLYRWWAERRMARLRGGPSGLTG